MCGRYTLAEDLDAFAKKMALKFDPRKFNPRYNIWPSQSVAVVLNDGSNEVTLAKWGLIPSWAKDPSIGNRLANARSDSIEHKPAFRSSFKRKRCLVLSDGYFEWQSQSGQKLKVPWYFRLLSKEVFGFAGLWSSWKDTEGKETITCCLITTEANAMVEPVHHRMPVIVQERFRKIWISEGEQPVERLRLCLDSVPAAKMEKYTVSTLVNKPQ